MTVARHGEISVGEPWDFEGNDGPNRVIIESMGIVPGPGKPNWAPWYLLLRVVNPFEHEAQRVEWLLASPRYQYVTLDTLSQVGGAAGIARLRPGVRLTPSQPLNAADVDYFMIGQIAFK